MRKHSLLVLLALVVGGAAAAATGITLITGTRYEFTNCAAGGSAAQTVAGPGTYVFRVLGEDTAICYAATCAAGGEWFPSGTVMLLYLGASQQISCRSSGATGDAIFTRGQ